ncbi:DNA polymerase III subunit chi [Aquisalimonas sp. 2447]|uniref:DNA polymerase III subunit chi n=1 Tax=Aquisalimonas sp. 2447 TaxID=2740807 RepID=UPI001432624C|nr:DNA polymerase III subunit chi [Aquisalimonas sp. 2447]QIT56031.1 DNA polymerase III subunit chi [Aquisalimonas sp. 2447]
MSASQVDFHILASADENARRSYACRVVEKARERGHHVYLRVADDTAAGELDNLLWTFRDRSFLPHAVDAPGAPDEPVLIGTADGPSRGEADVLVNLALTAPGEPARYARIVEIGDNQDEVLRAARQRFRTYRDMGITPEHRTVEGV